MRADYHLHCEFSDDSRERMENQIEQAIALGLDEICFTDHVDYGINRVGEISSPLSHHQYVPFGIRRFNITSKRDAHYSSQGS